MTCNNLQDSGTSSLIPFCLRTATRGVSQKNDSIETTLSSCLCCLNMDNDAENKWVSNLTTLRLGRSKTRFFRSFFCFISEARFLFFISANFQFNSQVGQKIHIWWRILLEGIRSNFFDEFSNSSPTVKKRVDEMPLDF